MTTSTEGLDRSSSSMVYSYSYVKVCGRLTRLISPDSLKKNPVMGEGELDNVAGGLGKEAAQQGLGGVSSKLGGLGKF